MRSVQVQVVQHLKPGGIETMALDFLRRANLGQEVHIVSLEGQADEACAAWPRLEPFMDKLHFLNKQPGLSFQTLFKLKSLLYQLGATAVQTHHVGPLLYGGLAARLAGIRRVVHTEHDAWHLQDARRRMLQSFLISLVRPILVADSHLVADELAKVLPKKKYIVISNGVDCDLFSPGDMKPARRKLDLPSNVPIIGCAGRMEPVKAQAHLLKAHALMSQTVHLALAGTGSLEQELKNLVQILGTEKRVHFLGRIDDMPTFYKALNVFCLPSKMEGMPLSPLEAQASGVVCVATDVGGMREAVCPKTGIIITDESPCSLATGLRQALANVGSGDPRAYPLAHANLETVINAYQKLLLAEKYND
ncbi:MAG: glycosyl transferase [Rhodospirillaceae bacterium]|nr:MAG: glycosyl transferase [Rhodospirillaceae bacterium]